MKRLALTCCVVSTFAMAALTLAANPAEGSNAIVVGTASASCPSPDYSTIQAAVNHATPGATIRICAGIYPEQVKITESLTLVGDNEAVIEPSNVIANTAGASSGQPIAAIVLVENATDVNIRNVTVDGTNNGITSCAPDLIGIYYQNASGEMRRLAVRNVKLSASLNGCQSGDGILIASTGGGNAVVQVRGSSVHDYQKNGITANETGTQATIENNEVTGVGPTTGAAQNGIQVGFGATGNITNNTVANNVWSPCVSLQMCETIAQDILVTGSDNVTVDGNTVGVAQVGIGISGNRANVHDNHVFDAMVVDGLELIGNTNVARNNVITHSDRAGVFIDGNDNDVQGNRINDAAFGVLKNTGTSGNSVANNDFFNTAVTVQDPPAAAIPSGPYR